MKYFSLKAYLNFLSRNKLYTAINVVGFAVSLAFVILVSLYTAKESAVDSFHTNKDRVFRLRHETYNCFPFPIRADIEADFPEVEAAALLISIDDILEVQGSEKTREKTLYTNASFFNMFSFPVTEGRVFTTSNEVVLTRSTARKLFGSESAVGKTILRKGAPYTVCGVAEDFKHSHFNNPAVVAMIDDVQKEFGGKKPLAQNYGNCSFEMYLLAREGSDLTPKIPAFIEYFKGKFFIFRDGHSKTLKLEPLDAIYFTDNKSLMVDTRSNSRSFISVLFVMVLAVLLFAVTNYINLSVAQAGFRAKEAATRRLLGGTRKQLFGSFILESIFLCAVSFVGALLISYIAEPLFQQTMNSDIFVSDIFSLPYLLFAIGGIVLLGVLSGMIPAYQITLYKPIEVVRGTFRQKTKGVYSKLFILFQYFITVVLIASTIVLYRQSHFLKNTDLGYNRENVVMIDAGVGKEKTSQIRTELMKIPGVESIGFTAGNPIDGGQNYSYSYDNKSYSIQEFHCDTAAWAILGFGVEHWTGNDADSAVFVSRNLWNKIGLKEGDMSFYYSGETSGQLGIKGIIRDFYFQDLTRPLSESLVRVIDRENWWGTIVKTDGSDPQGVLDEIRKKFKNLGIMDYPVEIVFFNDKLKENYLFQDRTLLIVATLSLVAVFTSAMGLLAMSTYFMRQRRKEVAVRKIFGSKHSQSLLLIMKTYLVLVLVAFVVAVPVAWYLSQAWLAVFVYRIDLTASPFVIAGLFTLLLSSVTVLWQALKVIRENPSNALKE